MQTEPQRLEAEAAQPGSTSNFRLLLLAVFLLALGLRLHFVAASTFENVIRGDSVEYVGYAYNLVNRGVFSSVRPDAVVAPPDSYRGPGYPAFLAVAIAAAGNSLSWIGWVRCAQAIMGALIALLTAILARRMLPPAAAIASGMLVAVWPHLITINAYLLSESLAGFLLMLALTVSVIAVRAPSSWRLAAAGLLWGLAYLVNPIFLLAPLLFLPWLFREQKKNLLLVFLLASWLMPIAWSFRNASLPDGGKSTSSRALTNFVQGSWPDLYAAYDSRNAAAEPALIMSQISAEDNLIQSDKLAGLSSMFARMSKDPWRYAFWYLAYKPFMLWDWSIQGGNGDLYVFPTERSPFEQPGLFGAIKYVTKAINPLFFLVAVVYGLVKGVLLFRRGARYKDFPSMLLVLLFAYLTMVHAVLSAEPRYSIPYRPVEFLMVILAAHALYGRLRAVRTTSQELKKGQVE
jgi:4-amino-4-deoxy-L-arabinose transferase-like glycosyltransferase